MNVEGIGFVTMCLRGAFDLLGTLEGISRNGLQLDLLPTGPEAEPAPGDTVSLVEMPKGLHSIIGGLSGHVIWTQGSRCGVAFDTPVAIEDGTLEQRLRDNNLLPWSHWAV